MKISIIFDIELEANGASVPAHAVLFSIQFACEKKIILEKRKKKERGVRLREHKKQKAKIEGTRTKGNKIIGFLNEQANSLSFSLSYSFFLCVCVSLILSATFTFRFRFLASALWMLYVSHEDLASITYYLCDPLCCYGANQGTEWKRMRESANQRRLQQRRLHMAKHRYDCKSGKMNQAHCNVLLTIIFDSIHEKYLRLFQKRTDEYKKNKKKKRLKRIEQ